MHIIPEHPTPAQRKLITSDWFQAALKEVIEFERHHGQGELEELETWSPEARLIADMNALHHKGKHKDTAHWDLTCARISRRLLPMSLYAPSCIDILSELMIAMELLQPEDEQFHTSYKGFMYGGSSAAADDHIVSAMMREAREDVAARTERVQEIQRRLAQAPQLDEATSLRLATLVRHFPSGRPNSMVADTGFRAFQDMDPVVFLTRCFDCALEPERGVLKPDTHGSGWMANGWSPKNLLWHIVANTFRAQRAVLDKMSNLVSLFCHFISMSPVRFTQKSKTFYMSHLKELFVDTGTFSSCVSMLTQSNQLPVAREMIHFPGDRTWSDVIKLMHTLHISTVQGVLQVWVFGQKAYRSELMHAQIKRHASAQQLLSVTLDAFAFPMTPSRQKVIIALYEQLALSFDHTQQLALAPGIASTFKGKALKTMQAFAPDVDWTAIKGKAAPGATVSAKDQ
jgi:hypothetical protein